MINKITLFITLGLVCLGLNLHAQSTSLTINPPTASIDIGDTLVVQVTATDFDSLSGLNHSIFWDPTILQFVEDVDQAIPRNLPADFAVNDNLVENGQLVVNWFENDVQPYSVPDDTILYEIVRFTAIAYGSTSIMIPDEYEFNQAIKNNGNFNLVEFVPQINNATVTVEEPGNEDPGGFECMFDGFGMAIGTDSVMTGEQVCLPVYSCNWDTLTSIQYSVNFNPALFQFDSLDNVNVPVAEELQASANNTTGNLVVNWVTNDVKSSLADTVAFDLCFTAIGAGGTMDSVLISGDPLPIEVTNSIDPSAPNIGMEYQGGNIVILGNSGSAVTINAEEVEGSPGDTVCVPITTQNFMDITGFQFSMTFDTAALTFYEIQNINTDLTNFAGSINSAPSLTDTGAIAVIHPEALPVNLTNGTTLFDACFIIEADAVVGSDVLVGFSDNPVALSAAQSMVPAPLLSNDGHITILPGDVPDGLQLTLGSLDVCPDSAFCTPVVVDYGYNNINSAFFQIVVDPTTLTYTGFQNVHPVYVNDDVEWDINYNNSNNRITALVFPDFNDSYSVPIGDTLVEFCFEAASSPVSASLDFGSTIEIVEVGNSNPVDPTVVNNATITITTDACPFTEPPIEVTETITQIACNGETTGSIGLAPITGGNGMPVISWEDENNNPLGNTPTLINLGPGTYSVTITSGAQTFMDSYTITQPEALSLSQVATDASCNNADDGSINLTIGGGVADYSVVWTGTASTMEDLTDLAPGMYTPTVTDANMCTVTIPPITISEPDVLTVTIDSTTNVSCLDGNDGAVYISVTGGSGTYTTYAWTGTGQTTADITGLAAGNYQVTVTDDKGCTGVSNAVTITEPSTGVVISVDNITPVNCNGNGSIDISVTGGTPPYTSYEWSNMATTEDLTNAIAGGYTVTVTDSRGCSAASNIIVVPTTAAINITETISQPNCDSQSDGSISLNVTGGSGNSFTYNWDPVSAGMTANPTGLTAGTYNVTVTDSGDGCTATASYTLTNQVDLTITQTASTPAGCAGATNGSVTITTTGGGGTYSYNWGNGTNDMDNVLNDVAAGSYPVTVTDMASGCEETATFTVDSEGGIVITQNGITDASCDGASNGAIDITATGPGMPFTYAWSASAGNATTEDVSGLVSGEHVVTVTSADGLCTQTASFTVGAGDGFEVSGTIVQEATCSGADNGVINLTVTGQSGMPTFAWSNSETTPNITNAVGGATTTVTVTDAAGCIEVASFVVPSGSGFDITLESITNASCSGAADGSIDISTTGVPDVTFAWVDGNNNSVGAMEDLTNVTAGTYTVMATDAVGCVETATFTIEAGTGFSITLESITNASCGGATDGAIDIATDATTPSFVWSNGGGTNEDLSGVMSGEWTVTVTDDASGCTAEATYTIDNDSGITATVASIDAVSCNGESDGAINLTVANASTNLSFDWSVAIAVGQNPTGLPANTYSVTITDEDSGCNTVLENIEVPEAELIALAIDNNDITCNGDADGTITVMPSGGTPTYSYAWAHDVAETSNMLTGLSADTYFVTVTDSEGCTVASSGIAIAEPDAIVVIGQVTNLTGMGNNGAIDLTGGITGGSGTYVDYDWTSSSGPIAGDESITGLTADTYTVVVTDDLGCTGTNMFTINAADAPTPELVTVTNVSCFGESDGAIMITVGGGTPPYQYAWDGPTAIGEGEENNPTGLGAGTYSVTVTDNAGAEGVLTGIVVGQPNEIDVNLFNLTAVSCPEGDDGTISIVVMGGDDGPYTVDWGITPVPTDPFNITGLVADSYTPTVTDASGCSTIGEVIMVNQLPPIVITMAALTDPACNMGGTIDIDVEGGTGPYTYNWEHSGGDDITPIPELTNLNPGTYMLTVTDENDCQVTAGPYELSAFEAIVISIDSITHVTCPGEGGGEIFTSISGGVDPVTTIWLNNNGDTLMSSPNLIGVIGGQYQLQVTDAEGCVEATAFEIVDEPQPITTADVQINPVTASGDDGEIRLITVTGGNDGGYAFNWEGPNDEMFDTGSTPILSDLIPGAYTVTVTDSEGCTEIFGPYVVDGMMEAIAEVTNPSCNGGNDGSIVLEVVSATAPITYEWEPDLPGLPIQGSLTAGTYTVTITDANGLMIERSWTLAEPSPIEVTFDITNANGNECDGFINTSVNGGAPSYTYMWNNGSDAPDLFNACKGTYSVTITDANGCIVMPPEQTVTGGPLSINANPPASSCNNGASVLTADAVGGCAPYTFVLDPGTAQEQTLVSQGGTVTFTGIGSGDHILTLTDGELQTTDFSFTVAETVIEISALLITDNTAAAPDCNGAINIDVQGGQIPYNYLWSTGDTSQDLANVCPNETPANVTVTDGNGCIAVSEEFIVIQGITIAVEAFDETCVDEADGSIITDVSGGVPGYDYLWNDGEMTPNRFGLEPGTYTLTVTDDSGRTTVISETINGSDSPIELTAEITTPTGANADGAIDITVTGGGGGYDYVWSQNGMEISPSPPDLSGLTPGTYTVEVIDVFGCVYSETFTLGGIELTLTFQQGNTGCFNTPGDNGTLQVMASGGVGPYSYVWSNGESDDIIGGLATGDYTVTVTDASGLTAEGTGTVDPLQDIDISLESDALNGRITSVVTGGIAPYSYRWSDNSSSTTANLENVTSGIYTLVVTDDNGCVGSATIDVSNGPCEDVTKIVTPNNDGFNDEFKVNCITQYTVELEIFNRWGKRVYVSTAYDNSWIGIDQDGERVPEGGYFYVIRYEDGTGTQQIKGAFNIVY